MLRRADGRARGGNENAPAMHARVRGQVMPVLPHPHGPAPPHGEHLGQGLGAAHAWIAGRQVALDPGDGGLVQAHGQLHLDDGIVVTLDARPGAGPAPGAGGTVVGVSAHNAGADLFRFQLPLLGPAAVQIQLQGEAPHRGVLAHHDDVLRLLLIAAPRLRYVHARAAARGRGGRGRGLRRAFAIASAAVGAAHAHQDRPAAALARLGATLVALAAGTGSGAALARAAGAVAHAAYRIRGGIAAVAVALVALPGDDPVAVPGLAVAGGAGGLASIRAQEKEPEQGQGQGEEGESERKASSGVHEGSGVTRPVSA